MTRGDLSYVKTNPVYMGSAKKWHITLQQSTCYWFDLIVNPPDFADTRGHIVCQLNHLKEEVENKLEKRFIYFFASRTKVRFDTTQPPTYSTEGEWLTLTFLVGRDKKKVQKKLRIRKPDGSLFTPEVEISVGFIRFYSSPDDSETFPIHDFLQRFNINLGISTQLQYIGITKNPSDRPLSRKHRGIADTLYNVSNEDNDFFIYINLFEVVARAIDETGAFRFLVNNARIDEIPTDEEGKVIESVLISYFECSSQDINRSQENAKLNKKIAQLSDKNKINSISLHLEVDSLCDYFNFGSSKVLSKKSHTFMYSAREALIILDEFDSEEDLFEKVYKTDCE